MVRFFCVTGPSLQPADALDFMACLSPPGPPLQCTRGSAERYGKPNIGGVLGKDGELASIRPRGCRCLTMATNARG